MVIKLSDYILEQSVSDAQIVDIFLEQDLAEIEVCCNLCKAYLKQIELESYYEPIDDENSAPDNVVTEASAEATADGGESTNPITKVLKAIGGAIAGFFKWIGNKIGAIGDKIKKNSKKYKDIAEHATDEDYQRLMQYLDKVYDRDISRIYAAYSPANIKEFLDAMTAEIPKFASEAAKFIDQTKNFVSFNGLRKDEKNGQNIAAFNAYLDHFKKVILETNPFNKTAQGSGEDSEGFKSLMKSYIMYYTSSECINTIMKLNAESKKAYEIIFRFDRKYQVTRKHTTTDYQYDHTSLPTMTRLKEHVALGSAYKNDKYNELKQTTQRALDIVSSGSSNSVMGAISKLDKNLKALEVLGKNDMTTIDSREYDDPEGKGTDWQLTGGSAAYQKKKAKEEAKRAKF